MTAADDGDLNGGWPDMDLKHKSVAVRNRMARGMRDALHMTA